MRSPLWRTGRRRARSSSNCAERVACLRRLTSAKFRASFSLTAASSSAAWLIDRAGSGSRSVSANTSAKPAARTSEGSAPTHPQRRTSARRSRRHADTPLPQPCHAATGDRATPRRSRRLTRFADACPARCGRGSHRCRAASARAVRPVRRTRHHLQRRLLRRFGSPFSFRARRRRPSGEGSGPGRSPGPGLHPSAARTRSPRPTDHTAGCQHRWRE